MNDFVPRLNTRKPSMFLGIARVLVMCAVSALFGWFVFVNAVDLGYAGGWAGTPGTLTDATCLTDGPVTCSAQFQANARGSSPEPVGITGHDDLSSARTYPATLPSDGEYATVTGRKATAESLAGLAFFLLLFVLAFGYGVLAFTQRLGRQQRWWRWEPSNLVKLTPAVLAGFFALIAGLCAILATRMTL